MATLANHQYICNCCHQAATVQQQESLVPGRELIQVDCLTWGCENWKNTQYAGREDFSSYYTPASELETLLRRNAETVASREIQGRLAS